MPKSSLYRINAGEILLNKLCVHFNNEIGHDQIENWKEMDVNDKYELIDFINRKINNGDFNIRSLNRIIRNVKNGDLRKKIPTRNPTLCTLCYVVCNAESPYQKPFLKVNHGNVHAASIYAIDFNKKYVVPFLALTQDKPSRTSNKRFQQLIDSYVGTVWYVHMNLFIETNGIKKRFVGRRILRFIQGEEEIIVEYSIYNISLPDWTGKISFDASKGLLYLTLRTEKNKDRLLVITLRIGDRGISTIIHGQMTHTKDQTVYNHIIVLTRFNDSNNKEDDKPPKPIILDEDEPTIKSISEYLKRQQKTTFKYDIPLHNCFNEIGGID